MTILSASLSRRLGISVARAQRQVNSPAQFDAIRAAKRPVIVAGGGVHYSGATDALAAFCRGA